MFSASEQLTLTLLRTRRLLFSLAPALSSIALVGFAYVPILREAASFLIVEDSLKTAVAIVALAGQTPFRELEAAKLYREGWAPQVVLVREAPSDESEALKVLNIKKVQAWEIARVVLIQQGVPASSILVPKDDAMGTLEELKAAYGALQSKDAPVILVTSKYHTRRTRLTWEYVTQGRSQAVVRAASGDPFDPERWWHSRQYALSVVREYFGLMNYYAGFVVAP